MNPKYVNCGFTGIISRLKTGKSLLFVIIGLIILYYSWSYIEAILILLPIPDPKEVMGKIGGMFPSRSSSNAPNKGSYEKGFDKAPESLDEEDEEDLSG